MSKLKISGYVVAFNRKSRRLNRHNSYFYEEVERGAFHKTITDGHNITLVINHDNGDVIANTKDGTLELYEDFIGLRFIATIDRSDVFIDVLENKISNCSFQFRSLSEAVSREDYKGCPVRVLRDVKLTHVSLIREPKKAAYDASTVKAEVIIPLPPTKKHR